MEPKSPDILKKLRQQKGLSQKRLAETISISPKSILLWEKGIKYPSLGSVIKLACFFKVRINFLLGLED